MSNDHVREPLDADVWAPDYFLGKGALLSTQQIEASSAQAFSIARRANRVGHELLTRLSISPDDFTGQILATLFGRMLYSFQGVVILCARGLRFPAATELRALLEMMFKLIAISRDPLLAKVFVGESTRVKAKNVKSIKRLRELSPSAIAHMSSTAVAELENRLNKETALIGSMKKMEIGDWAKSAKHELLYLTVYSQLSSVVHANAISLEEMMLLDGAVRLKSLKYGPDTTDNDDFLLTATEFLILSIKACCVSFSLLPPENMELIANEIASFPV